MSDLTYASIWATLSKQDCSEFIEKKQGLSYLSWAWAWGLLMEHYPQAEFHFEEDDVYPNNTMSVNCTVTIGECTRSMWLPVMDYKNKAIVNPDARDISDTRMRCLVKCLALYGLGHSIFGGEDVPRAAEPKEAPKAKPKPVDDGLPDEVTEVKPDPEDIAHWSPEFAGETVDQMIELARSMSSTVDQMKSFWKANTIVIGGLQKHHPKQHARLKETFTAMRRELEAV